MPAARSTLLAACCALVPLASACRQTIALPPEMRVLEPEPGQMDIRRDYWDRGPKPQRLKSEVEGLVQRGGAFEKHGRERTFYRSGQIEAERHWIHGAPARIWRAWWENGAQKSTCEFTPDGRMTEMSFWHANGQLEARGSAINGRRYGHWDFFYESGAKESSGEFQDGKREGEWTRWDECGDVLESGFWRNGVKAPAQVPS